MIFWTIPGDAGTDWSSDLGLAMTGEPVGDGPARTEIVGEDGLASLTTL